MFDRELVLYNFVLGYAKSLAADIDDAKFADQPAPGLNHPAWILGHLAIATDFASRILGGRMALPAAWHRQFGPGSTLSSDRADYPSKEELISALIAGHERAVAAVLAADPAQLTQPHGVPIAFLKDAIPTVGDLLAHLMTTHPSIHLGQLSAWRRMMGMPGALQI